MKKILCVLFALMILVGCSSSNSSANNTPSNPLDSALLNAPKIIIGTSPDYPPFESLNAAGEVEGFEIDLAAEVAAILNEQQGTAYEIEFKQMDFSTIISALQASQIDIGMSGFTYSPERDCIFATPHLVTKQVVVIRAEDYENGTITVAEDIIGKKCCAGQGTTGAEALGAVIGSENIMYPGDYTYMFEVLGAGQVDVVVCDEAVGINYVNEKGFVMLPEPLVNEEMSFIIKTGNTVLADAVNQAVEAFMASDSYQQLKDKYGL